MSTPKISLPPELAPLNDQPGCCWPPHKREALKAWLWETPARPYLWLLAYRRLGRAATMEDAEDTLMEYCLRRLDGDINKYDPTKGRPFWPFLCQWFGYFCQDEGQRLRRHFGREQSLQTQDEEGDILEVEFADEAEHANPEQQVSHGQSQEQFLTDFNKGLATLPRQQRQAFELRNLQGWSVQETAERMGISIGYVRVLCSRARNTLRRYLQEKGWNL